MIAGRYNKWEKSLSEPSTAHGERLILVDLDVGSDESVKACGAFDAEADLTLLSRRTERILKLIRERFMDPSSVEAEQRL
ncbi:hypothetical protein [Paenibacillus lutimineralis]|uniref:Uncharacterized protein n=1 Tax=Paenibacillus lutimineralis TaxID=2707005 RepID=A0A3S9UVA6_9BACL|nr:hypothetical protein [Paenibacillus lutimineralis]AZS14265.1 hypothetical protein EI981_07180 [Paenibacillus lutimineralis]